SKPPPGFHRSIDQGVTWITTLAQSIDGMVIDPHTRTKIFAVSHDSQAPYGAFLQSSMNGGVSWGSPVPIAPSSTPYSPSSTALITIDPTNSTTMYLAAHAGAGVLKTEDGGGSWQSVGRLRPTLVSYPPSIELNVLAHQPIL